MLRKIQQTFIKYIVNRDRNFIDPDEESRFRNYTVFCITGIVTMLGFGFSNTLKGNGILVFAVLSCSAALAVGWYLLYRCLFTRSVYRVNALLFCLLLLYLAALGGKDGSKLLWIYTFPLVACFLFGNREGAIWTSVLLAFCQLVLWNPFGLQQVHNYPPEFSLRFSVSFIIIFAVSYFYEQFRYNYRAEIEKKNRQLRQEVVDRERVETALRKSKEAYKAIYLQAAEGIFLIDAGGAIVDCNPQLIQMLGMTRDTLIGSRILDLIHPDDLQAQPSQIPRILHGDTIQLERRLRTADGSYLSCEFSGRMIEDNKIMILCRDITQRKAVETTLERANRELARLANIDGLTQIANRRKFETVLLQEWQRLAREQLPLSIILCDIDFFKQYNDLYGHQEGDSCLIHIAQTLEAALNRPADLACRFGGEEFIIMLPNTDLGGGILVADEMRKRIYELRIAHNDSDCNTYVTMSFGVSSVVPSTTGLPEDLVATADKALYLAKQKGRNRVEQLVMHLPKEKTGTDRPG